MGKDVFVRDLVVSTLSSSKESEKKVPSFSSTSARDVDYIKIHSLSSNGHIAVAA